MECTQRLECTQDFSAESFSQRSGPDQIGFLGICGQTYPVNLGPNKIGRDPQTCSIALDMKSLSRQHAVINVLNKREYMLMDLGSINKTKLGIKALQAYIPYPLKNGDTVQFGDVFGIFRLCEEDNELPMTQQCDVPDTPVQRAFVGGAGTLVPESPDVSDKDDSFVAASQQPKETHFKTPKTHFIKTSGKTILRPSIGSNKIDNIYWDSSQKSPLLRLDESDDTLNDTSSSANTIKTIVNTSPESKDIHEMDTQVLPGHNDATDSIHTASTQLPTENNSLSIHFMATQIPIENLPSVHKVEQNEMLFELAMSSRDNSIHDAQTQAFPNINEAVTQPFDGKSGQTINEVNTQLITNKSVHNENTQVATIPIHNALTQIVTDDIEDEDIPCSGNNTGYKKLVVKDEKTSESDEEILDVFDNIDEAEFTPKKTAPLFKDSLIKTETKVEVSKTPKTLVSPTKEESKNTSSNKMINESDEEICFQEIDDLGVEPCASQPLLPTDISPNKSSDKENPEAVLRETNSQSPIIGVRRSNMRLDSDSSTDCEDIAMLPTQNIVDQKDAVTNCGGTRTTHIPKKDINMEVAFDEMATQILEEDLPQNSPILQKEKLKKYVNKKRADVRFNEVSKHILEKKTPIISSAEPSPVCAQKCSEKREESFEEMATQILEEDDLPKDTSTKDEVDFEDMPTQIIDEDDINDSVSKRRSEVNIISNDVDFEDMSTQIIDEDVQQYKPIHSEETVSPFKIPFISPIKIKRKDLARLATANNNPKPPAFEQRGEIYYAATQEIIDDLCTQPVSDKYVKDRFKKPPKVAATANNIPKPPAFEPTGEKYYAATQEIIDDLCTQQVADKHVKDKVKKPSKVDDEIVLCSDEEFEIPDRFRHIEQVTPKKVLVVADISSCEDDDEKVNEYVSRLSATQINEVVGLSDTVATLSKKSSSDLSDVEITPKKVHPLKFMNALLPDSQEIKVSVTTGSRLDKTESSSESETETNSQENTPILFKKKVRSKKDAKMDLTKKFDADALPTRIIGRVRKPPAKFMQHDNADVLKILNPKFLTEQEDNIDTEIITENITRLKNNNKKKDVSEVTNKKANASKNDVKTNLKKDKDARKTESGDNKNKTVVDNSKEDKFPDKKIKSIEKISEELKKRLTRKSDDNHSKKSVYKSNDNINSKETTEGLADTKTRSKVTSEKPKTKDIVVKPKENERKSDEKTSEKSTNTKPPLVTKGILKNQTIEEMVNLDSDQEDPKTKTVRFVRSTRGRKKVEEQSVTPEPPSKSEDVKARPPSRRGKKSYSPPLETEPVRRSKRQKNTDSQNDSQDTVKSTKAKGSKKTDSQSQNDSQTKMTSFLKAAKTTGSQSDSQAKTSPETALPLKKRKLIDTEQDQSTVYNISSESHTDTPKGDKRPAPEVKGPSAKRTRSAIVNTAGNRSLRSTTIQKVLFTAFPNEEVKSKLEKIGATIVSDVLTCDVLVTLQIKRTFKLLCVVGLGKPIVGPGWVQACVDNNRIVDPWQHLMRDEAAEKRFGFDLQRTLAGRRQFLSGYAVSSTPNVMPNAPEMKLIVESSGGKWKTGGPKWLCVSTSRDKDLWPALRKRGATVVSTELILAGVLRQELDLEANTLLSG